MADAVDAGVEVNASANATAPADALAIADEGPYDADVGRGDNPALGEGDDLGEDVDEVTRVREWFRRYNDNLDREDHVGRQAQHEFWRVRALNEAGIRSRWAGAGAPQNAACSARPRPSATQ